VLLLVVMMLVRVIRVLVVPNLLLLLLHVVCGRGIPSYMGRPLPLLLLLLG
jgi:hypothetical protein